jgi:hypothetical protein
MSSLEKTASHRPAQNHVEVSHRLRFEAVGGKAFFIEGVAGWGSVLTSPLVMSFK